MRNNERKIIILEDDQLNISFDIEGVKFEPNVVFFKREKSDDICRVKFASSPGPLISDFVTHQANFKYATAGIHVSKTTD